MALGLRTAKNTDLAAEAREFAERQNSAALEALQARLAQRQPSPQSKLHTIGAKLPCGTHRDRRQTIVPAPSGSKRGTALGSGRWQHHRIHSFLAKDAFFLGNNEGGLLLRISAFLKGNKAARQKRRPILKNAKSSKTIRVITHSASIVSRQHRHGRSSCWRLGAQCDAKYSGATSGGTSRIIRRRRVNRRRNRFADGLLATLESDAEGVRRRAIVRWGRRTRRGRRAATVLHRQLLNCSGREICTAGLF